MYVSQMSGCAPAACEVGAAGEVEGTQGDEAAERAERAVPEAVAVAQIQAGQPRKAAQRLQARDLAAALQVHVHHLAQACSASAFLESCCDGKNTCTLLHAQKGVGQVMPEGQQEIDNLINLAHWTAGLPSFLLRKA